MLTHRATHDELTGLPNRTGFAEALDARLVRSSSGDAPTAVLFLDLDGFKQINDELGHEAGDLVLQVLPAGRVALHLHRAGLRQQLVHGGVQVEGGTGADLRGGRRGCGHGRSPRSSGAGRDARVVSSGQRAGPGPPERPATSTA